MKVVHVRDIGDNLGCLLVIVVIVIGVVFLLNQIYAGDDCRSNTFACRDHQVQLCLKSEQYSRDECIKLVGTGVK